MSIYKYPLCVPRQSDRISLTFTQEPPTPGDRRIDRCNPLEGNPFDDTPIPQLSMHDIKIIKDALLPNGTIPGGCSIDKACLLAIYDYIIEGSYFPSFRFKTTTVLVSQMRCARAARLIFEGEYRFTWNGWVVKHDEPDNEVSRITVESISWTRWVKRQLLTLLLTSVSYTIPRKVSPESQSKYRDICCHSEFKSPPLYREAWLAQGDRIVSQLKSSCTRCELKDLRLGKQIGSRSKMV